MVKVLSYREVQNWVRKCFNPTTLVPKKFRTTLVGVIMTIGFGEVCMYKMVKQDIRAGEMPSHLSDTLIIGYGILEMVLAPLVSWWGYRRRRTMLITWVALVLACLCTWFLLPSSNYRRESEFCNDDNKFNDLAFTGVSRVSAIRLTIFLVTGVVFIMARVGVLSHGLAYLEEYAPERIPLHFSIFVIARILPLLIGTNFITMIDKSISIQCTVFSVGTIVHLLQLHLFIPKTAPEVKGVLKTPPPMDDRSFSHSIARVLSNPLVISQLLAMALLAASLWGYAFYRLDIIQVKFNIEPKRNSFTNFSEIIQYIFLVVVVAFAGIHLSHPILLRFCKLKAIKQVIMMSALAFILYVLLMTVPTCDKGEVAGMRSSSYESPECSSQCGCQPRWQEFSPVCMLDEMTTYLSPCQAGCSAQEYVNGISTYVNCTCGGRAFVGACNDGRCRSANDVHQTLFVLLVAVIIMALSAQGVVLLKAVDERDRAVVLGVGCATTALVVNVCVHTYFAFIRAGSCGWLQGGRCHVASDTAPALVGASSAVLVSISLIISLVTWLRLRRSYKK